MEGLPANDTVVTNFAKTYSIVNRRFYNKILATISGGSDSDVMLDILARCDVDKKITYLWVDTGLEYEATKWHLEYLQNKYNIVIKKVRSREPIPVAIRKYGQPFVSKRAADMISRLQKHNFEWEDKPFDELYRKYPKCKAGLMWWCNQNKSDQFNIRYNKLLKEFLIKNSPTFRISSKCCNCSKKKPIHDILDTKEYDLNVYGVRKAEGGVRSTAYHSCFNEADRMSCDEYRPLYWYKSSDKDEYCSACDVTHSDCYTKYGLKRTGCAGCPFGRNFEYELKVLKKNEPKLYEAVSNIFKESIEYTRKYHQYIESH